MSRSLRRRLALGLALASAIALPGATASASDDVRLKAVVADGIPRGVVTVTVAVPEELRSEEVVAYEVRSTGGVQVLGKLAGEMRRVGGVHRPVVITLRVPAVMDAGQVTAADVSFRAPNGRTLVVPVILRIPVIRGITLQGSREMRGLRTGDRLELVYRVLNAGNASDTVVTELLPPFAWQARLTRPARMVIPARGVLEFTLHVFVPTAANVGDHILAVSIRASGQTAALSTIYTTLGVTGRAGEKAGLVVHPTVAMAASSEGTATFVSAALEGPISENVQVRAYLTPGLQRGGMMTQGLSAVGAVTTPFSASVFGRDWDLSAGNAGMQLSDLGGVNILGAGVTGHAETPDYELRGIVARPAGGYGRDGGLYGAGYWRNTTRGRFGGAASFLTERRGATTERELTAFSADYLSQPIGTVRIGGSLAHRQSGDISGVGLGLNVAHTRPGERATLRVTHAPGGSQAFARATDEWEADVAREITPRWSVDANLLGSHDANGVFSAMDVNAWSLGQRYELRSNVSVHLRAQSSNFTARTPTGGIGAFGAGERSLTGGAEWRRAGIAFTTEGALGVLTRSTELLDGSLAESDAPRQSLRFGASRSFERWGTLDANSGVEATGPGVGVPGQIWSTSGRWYGVPVTLLGRQLRLNSELSYQKLGDLQTAIVSRISAVVALPAGLDLAMSAERNPFFRDAQGRAGWVAAMRVSASARVLSSDLLGPEGLVFEDLDRDGVRDSGEPGVAGVVVRRGDAKATTNREGRYRLPLNARGRTRLDQASLRLGLVSHPLLASDSTERADLPVLPTGSLVVELALVPDDAGRIPNVSLEPAVVLLRDASGFEWVGRRVNATTAIFDGVPTGTYSLHLNITRLSEPLRMEEEISVTVSAHERRSVTIELRGRAVRIFSPATQTREVSP